MLCKQCSRSSWFALVGAVCIMLIGARSSRADIINVPGDYDTIQEAIEAAHPGDEVVVAEGEYFEHINFLGKAIYLHSSDGADVTTIDATGLDTSVVTCIGGEGPDTILEGFTVTGGVGTLMGDGRYGGGMLNIASSPTVMHCVFVDNVADEAGGGMCNLQSSSPTVTDCAFIGNASLHGENGGMPSGGGSPALRDCTAVYESARGYGWGGGMYNDDDAGPTVTNCTFRDNSADEGGCMFVDWGSAPTVTNCRFEANTADYEGGGISNHGALAVTDCAFIGNSAYFGGAISTSIGDSVTVSGCTFTENWAGVWGGGLFGYGTELTVSDCTFDRNSADDGGGGMWYGFEGLAGSGSEAGDRAGRVRGQAPGRQPFQLRVIRCTFTENSAPWGGGFVNDYNNSMIKDCTFIANSAETDGGGLVNRIIFFVSISGCTFTGNTAGGNGGGMYNMYQWEPDAYLITGCTFSGNTALGDGGGLHNYGTTPTLVNCTFSENLANSGGGMYNEYSSPAVTNCILWGDSGWEITNSEGAPVVTYSNVEGGYAGYGNIDADPLFVDAENGDFHLLPGSPCIDAGANSALPADSLDLDDDGDTAERVPLDLDGNARFADDPDTDDSGCGSPVIVDMGAYEFPGDAWHPMRIGDIDGNGIVNTTDLLVLLAAWGGYEDDCVLADLDYSGAVDTADLLSLLANWG